MTAFSLTSFTLAARNSNLFAAQLLDYFICEQSGHNPDAPCDRDSFRQLAYPGVTAVAFVLLDLFPSVNLVYALNVMQVKKKCARRRRDSEGVVRTVKTTVSSSQV